MNYKGSSETMEDKDAETSTTLVTGDSTSTSIKLATPTADGIEEAMLEIVKVSALL